MEPCERRLDYYTCLAAEGCSWTTGDLYDGCLGTPSACDTIDDESTCRGVQGCYWNPFAPCGGVPWACETLSSVECSVPGCHAWNVDAGFDAGPPPPWCPGLPGECDPFMRTCRAGFMCFVDPSFGTRCATTPTSPVLVGGACSPTRRCGSGLDCVDFGGGPECYDQCPAGSVGRCPTGYRCAGTGFHPAGCVDYCVYYGVECDPVRQNCSGTAESCYLVRDPETGGASPFCGPTGSFLDGRACTYANDCIEGASCIGGVCRQICNTTGDCTRGGACTGTIAGSPYRFCQ